MKGHAVGQCPVDSALRTIDGRWKPALIWYLMDGPKRYGELRRQVEGISERMLARQLRQLEADGIVARTVFPDVPPRVQYALTDRGHSLATILRQLGMWADASSM